MRRLVTFILVMMVMAVLVAPAAAKHHGDDSVWTPKSCKEAGGFWHQDRGTHSCNFMTDTAERPDSVGSDPDDPLAVLWAELERDMEAHIGFILFYASHQQRGAVGNRGTSHSHEILFDNVCEALGPQELVHPAVCAMLYQLLFPER